MRNEPVVYGLFEQEALNKLERYKQVHKQETEKQKLANMIG